MKVDDCKTNMSLFEPAPFVQLSVTEVGSVEVTPEMIRLLVCVPGIACAFTLLPKTNRNPKTSIIILPALFAVLNSFDEVGTSVFMFLFFNALI